MTTTALGGAGVREIVSPEGVPLRFAVASVGERCGAFMADMLILVAASVVLAVAGTMLALATRGVGIAVGMVAFFLLRNFYFTWFECLWQGATPGKRLLGLRVIDGRGGALTAESIFARNLMREVELFIPLAALLAPQALFPELPGWVQLLCCAWVFVCALLPLFNRDRLRVGDLVAGTVVVRAPRAVLREDLSDVARTRPHAAGAVAFTPEQLDLYGIRELQVLETLLREGHPSPATLEAVARKIQHKIGWSPPPGPSLGDADADADADGKFLRAFYTAQRARLEHRLLLGERRQEKRAGRLTRRP